ASLEPSLDGGLQRLEAATVVGGDLLASRAASALAILDVLPEQVGDRAALGVVEVKRRGRDDGIGGLAQFALARADSGDSGLGNDESVVGHNVFSLGWMGCVGSRWIFQCGISDAIGRLSLPANRVAWFTHPFRVAGARPSITMGR